MHVQGEIPYRMQYLLEFARVGLDPLESAECTGKNDEARKKDPSEEAR